MKQLAPDEKAVMVMAYTQNMLVRGEVYVKETVRVSIWLRTQGVPNFVHLIKPNVVLFGSGAPKTYSYPELFLPVPELIAFHIAPPASDPLDYDEKEVNRMMQPADVLAGTFLMKGKVRISQQTDFGTSLEVSKALWLSFYDAQISNPYLPQFTAQAPMMLVNTTQVSFALT
jgi:hypothetical protein